VPWRVCGEDLRGRNDVKKPGRLYKAAVIAMHALVGWAYCGVLIGVGWQILPTHATLVLHAVGAPVGFALISLLYYRKFAFTSPLQTALAFLGIVVALDLFLVAPIFEKNYAMFASALGTWIPFALIFAATYFTGRWSVVGKAWKPHLARLFR
jgi:hypothetical protein